MGGKDESRKTEEIHHRDTEDAEIGKGGKGLEDRRAKGDTMLLPTRVPRFVSYLRLR